MDIREKIAEIDSALKGKSKKIIEEREKLGLAGLVGGLECIIINVELVNFESTIAEFLANTGHDINVAFEDERFKTCVLSQNNSADVLVRCRKNTQNPFAHLNTFPRTKKLPNTRLETLVFEVKDIKKYTQIQKARGISFLSDEALMTAEYNFIQIHPSVYTGNSIGLVEWKKGAREYVNRDSRPLKLDLPKPEKNYLNNILYLDHVATRVKASDRDPAILEFMNLTNFNFDFAIYVESLNSITNVARLTGHKYASVFTSGIEDLVKYEEAGPTERFVFDYGARVHHMAFYTEKIEETFEKLAADGQRYLVDLVGSPEDGLKQTFTVPSKNTFIVNEYIHRYHGFDGFFTKSNVTILTKASDFSPSD